MLFYNIYNTQKIYVLLGFRVFLFHKNTNFKNILIYFLRREITDTRLKLNILVVFPLELNYITILSIWTINIILHSYVRESLLVTSRVRAIVQQM
jgi:hypothetical protein